MNQIDNVLGFRHWLSSAQPGSKAIYYDGFLIRDREKFIMAGGTPEEYPETIKTAVYVWDAYLRGEVTLVQKKRGQCSYDYIAVKL